jgi:integrative and conjugative element protein (TIGR02256 family)
MIPHFRDKWAIGALGWNANRWYSDSIGFCVLQGIQGDRRATGGRGRRTIFARSAVETLLAKHRLQNWRLRTASHTHPTVLNHLANHQQSDRNSSEAGDQLFARFKGEQIRVERATGPRAADRRSRYGYIPDRRGEQEEIDSMHSRGLHFIGDWHTHPERIPTPSASDIRSIRQAVTESKHHLNGFILLIAGTEVFPHSLFLALYSARGETAILLD